jgi:hypothetical protein
VSNFVTPSWFDPLAAPHAQFDKLGHLTKPFSILKGGYVVYESAGQEKQKAARWPEPAVAWPRPTPSSADPARQHPPRAGWAVRRCR